MKTPALSPAVAAILLWTTRVVVGGLFVVAGVLKLSDPNAFAIEIVNYRLLPELAPYAAVGLPPVEVAIGLAMVAPADIWRRAGAACATGLMVVFTLAVASAVARGMDVSCGCFGSSSGSVTWVTVARDIVLVLAAASLVVFPRPREAVTP